MIKKESVRKASLVTSLLNIAGRIIGFFSVFLISYFFGATNHTDVYYFALSFVTLIAAFFTSIQSAIMLPQFIRISEKCGEEDAWKFLNGLFAYTVIFTLAGTIIFAFFSQRIFLNVSQFPANVLSETKAIVLLFAPVIFFMILSDFLKNVIQAHSQFTFPSLMILFGNSIMTLMLLMFGKKMGVLTMVISVLLSFFLQTLSLYIYIVRRQKLFKWSFKTSKHHLDFFKLSLPILATQILGSFSMFYYDYSATFFAGGVLTAIAFAQKIFSLPNDMVITPVVNVVTPGFSEYYAKGNTEKLCADYLKYNNQLWFFIIPLSAFMIGLAGPIIEVFYGRGNFDENNISISALSLQMFTIGLFGLSYNAIATRVFFAMQKTLWVSVFSFVINILSVLITHIFVKKAGYLGIPLSRSFSVVFLSVSSGIVLSTIYLKSFRVKDILIPLIKMLVASALAIIIIRFCFDNVVRLFVQNTFVTALLAGLFFIVFAITFYFFCRILKMRESLFIDSLVQQAKYKIWKR